MVWHDRNGNRTQETGEEGLAGASVGLYVNGAQVGLVTTTTEGAYHFIGLQPGSYYLQEINPPEMRFSSTPDELSITLTQGQRVIVNFGDWDGLSTWLPLLLRGE